MSAAEGRARGDVAVPTPPLQQSAAVRERFQRIDQREVILDVQQLRKHFVTRAGITEALRDIHFKVHRRELVCVIGPSGCGKSTLIRILAGLEKQSSGRVLMDGQAVVGPGRDRGMVFQGYSLFPWLTVQQNVAFGPKIDGASNGAAERRARQWLDLVGLNKFAHAYPHQLSGGMRQRVAIARALVNEPRIMLMDEPFGALDAQTRSKMQQHLLDIWRNIDLTILFITHDLDEAIYLADRILVLKPHPGEVLELIEVPLPRPRSAAQFASAEFGATKARLEALIHPPSSAADADDEAGFDLRPMLRLTDVGNDVE